MKTMAKHIITGEIGYVKCLPHQHPQGNIIIDVIKPYLSLKCEIIEDKGSNFLILK
jgi:hypothetical protein